MKTLLSIDRSIFAFLGGWKNPHNAPQDHVKLKMPRDGPFGNGLASAFTHSQFSRQSVWPTAGKSAAQVHVLPAGEVEQLVFVSHCGLVLQLPHQCVDKVGVFDHNGHLLKHILEADAGLLQAAGVVD